MLMEMRGNWEGAFRPQINLNQIFNPQTNDKQNPQTNAKKTINKLFNTFQSLAASVSHNTSVTHVYLYAQGEACLW